MGVYYLDKIWKKVFWALNVLGLIIKAIILCLDKSHFHLIALQTIMLYSIVMKCIKCCSAYGSHKC